MVRKLRTIATTATATADLKALLLMLVSLMPLRWVPSSKLPASLPG